MKQFVSFAAILLCSLSIVAQDTVKASSFGFKPDDSTECLQTAINSGARTVIVDNVGKPWIVRPIRLRGNLELVFEDDVLVLAKEDAFHGPTNCMFTVSNEKDIVIRGGRNSELRMRKKDYQDKTRYSVSEWRHALMVLSCENVVIKNLTIKSSGGDGVYIGRENGMGCCRNVLAENIISDDHHRCAFSVICGRDILVRNCVMSNTKGTLPLVGFALEPNSPDEEQVNIVFENCESFGNADIGSYIFDWQVKGDGTVPPVSITYRNCNFHDNGRGAFFANPVRPGSTPVTGTFDFIGCSFQSKAGRVITFINCLENGIKFTFKDCKVIAGKACTAVMAFLVKDSFSAKAFIGKDIVPFGNIDLGNLQIIDEVERQPFTFGNFKIQGISTLTGCPTYQVGVDGKPQPVDLKKLVAEHQADGKLVESLRAFRPPKVFAPEGYEAERMGAGDVAGYEYRFRDANRYIQCVPKGTTARIKIKVTPFVDRPEFQNPKHRVMVTDQNGVKYPPLDVTEKEQVVELKAEDSDKVYVLSFNSNNPVNICSDSPGHGMVASAVSLAHSDTMWYFNVPADCENVNVLVNCENLEYVNAEMMDAMGKVVARLDHHDGIGCLHAVRSKTALKEMWSLRFTKAVEDYSFTLGDPLEPIVFTSPANSVVK